MKKKERTKEIIKLFSVKNEEELTKLYLKSDVVLLADNFEKLIKVSVKEFDIIPMYCLSLPVYTWQCALKYTNIRQQTLQDKKLISSLDNIRGGISSVMGDRYVYKKILYIHANNLYGWAMSEPLP